jgi:hypothetical protein
MKQTLEQKKAHTIIKSFYDYQSTDYLKHGKYIESILDSNELDDVNELNLQDYEAIEILADITKYMNDSFKAPELKTQLIYELFWYNG